MSSPGGPKNYSGSLLDTLAQIRTGETGKPFVLVSGQGSDLKNTAGLMNRAKRKIMTQKMVLSLIDVATRKKKPDRVRAYWNTYHCQNRIVTSEGRLHGKYCKNRFCTLCLSIRKATIINKYLPHLKTWNDCHFVTLTLKSIPASQLPRYSKGMIKVLAQIIEKFRKRGQRGKGEPLVGIRSLECNFNPYKRTYNPHFHILVKAKWMAEHLINQWLSIFTKKHANRAAQYYRKVDDIERDLVELIKYGSKIFTESDLEKKAKSKISPYVYVSALDNIFSALEGRRIFERFGFNLPARDEGNPGSTRLLTQFESWSFSPIFSDWLNSETGELLTGYQMKSELKSILKNNLNLELQ